MRQGLTTLFMLGTVATFVATTFGPTLAAEQQDGSLGAAARAPAPLEMLQVRRDMYMLVAGNSNITVQIGEEGVLLVDTGPADLTERVLSTIRAHTDKPIRWILNTHLHADHTGGNSGLSKAGRAIGQNLFGTGPLFASDTTATIVAHENVLLRMSGAAPGSQAVGTSESWPGSTYFGEDEELYFNREPVQLFWQRAGHTDGDSVVFFRRADVISTGDLFVTTTFPVIDVDRGGTINGVVDALNRIIDITIPEEKQEGGTVVIPGHGRLSDESEVVDYRDMVTIVRDRIQHHIGKGMTLEQIRGAKVAVDYEGRYGATTGPWTTEMFIEAAYKTLAPPPRPARGERR